MLYTGNPLTKVIIKNKVTEYVNAVYDSECEVKMENYNMKNGCYEGSFIINEMKHTFSAASKHINDKKVSEYYEKEMSFDIRNAYEFLSEKDEIWSDISTSVLFDSEYSKKIDELKVSQTFYMNVRLYSDNQEMTDKPDVIYKIINSFNEKYTINRFQIFVVDDNNSYEYVINKKENITIEEIRKSETITKRTDEEKEIELERR